MESGTPGLFYFAWKEVSYGKVTKVELQIDLSMPVEEIAAVVNIMLDAHPGRQIEILEAVDHAIGEALAKLQASDKSEKEE